MHMFCFFLSFLLIDLFCLVYKQHCVKKLHKQRNRIEICRDKRFIHGQGSLKKRQMQQTETRIIILTFLTFFSASKERRQVVAR